MLIYRWVIKSKRGWGCDWVDESACRTAWEPVFRFPAPARKVRHVCIHLHPQCLKQRQRRISVLDDWTELVVSCPWETLSCLHKENNEGEGWKKVDSTQGMTPKALLWSPHAYVHKPHMQKHLCIHTHTSKYYLALSSSLFFFISRIFICWIVLLL